MVDALNAEISLGTVANVDEGVQWLGYTYLHVRMRKQPLQYGTQDLQPLRNDHIVDFVCRRPYLGSSS